MKQNAPDMKSRRTMLALAAAAIAAAALPLQAAMAHDGKHEAPLPPAVSPGIDGAFSLIDQNGKAVTDKDFEGYYRLVYFGFTSCPDVCPTDLKKISEALKKTDGKKAARIAPLFITVDPDRDTPRVMKDYVGQFGPSFVGLTGSKEAIANAQAGYKVFAAKRQDPRVNGYMMDHSAYAYLMGPHGEFIDVFSHDDTADAIAKRLDAAVSTK